MCEIGLTQGLSLEGFLAFKKAKYGEPKKLTRKEWLAQYQDCGHCRYDGICRKQKLGYSQKYSTEEYINRIKNGAGYKGCCIWDADVANELYGKVEQLIGEVI